MRISTTFLPRPELARSDRIEASDTAVVIDVLRATSVMAMAIENGADRVVTTREVAQARSFADSQPQRPLLCGERACKPIEGFDLGNSPPDYDAARVASRTLVLTTTNGTRAIDFASGAGEMITLSFLNLSAGVAFLSSRASIHLVCAGTEGEITAEDVLLAGAILSLCETRCQATFTDDTSLIARQFWQACKGLSSEDASGNLAKRLRETRGGRNLIAAGYEQDIVHCAKVDSVQAVPIRSSVDPASFVRADR